MATITVKTQKELDELPSKFEVYTHVYIEATDRIVVYKKLENSSVEARGNSSVVAWDNSSVVALDNSSVEARDNSSVEAYDFSMIAVLWSTVIIKKLLDFAVVSLRGVPKSVIKEKSDTATIVETPKYLSHSFETHLERGYVMADGILKKLISQKKLGEITVFTVQEFPKKKESFVVKKGDIFSHGETVEKAIADLRYKISDRDTSRFKEWDKKTKVSLDDAIQAYRTITGACEFGTRQFIESNVLPEKLLISEVIKKTKGQFGHEQFKKFFNYRRIK